MFAPTTSHIPEPNKTVPGIVKSRARARLNFSLLRFATVQKPLPTDLGLLAASVVAVEAVVTKIANRVLEVM
ncbi:MAG: hypothetical protein AAEC10_08040 [Rhodospirillales bacterium]